MSALAIYHSLKFAVADYFRVADHPDTVGIGDRFLDPRAFMDTHPVLATKPVEASLEPNSGCEVPRHQPENPDLPNGQVRASRPPDVRPAPAPEE